MSSNVLVMGAVLLLSGCGKSEVVKILNSQSNYLVGEDINLTISYSYTDESVVTWTKNSSNIALWTTRLNDTNEKFQNIKLFGNGSLYISNVTTDYTDIYKVTTFDKSGTREASITVNIFERSGVVKIFNSQNNYLVGENINLTILYSYRDESVVTWTKNSSNIALWTTRFNDTNEKFPKINLFGNGSLYISSVTTDYTDIYKVTTFDEFGTGEASITVNIFERSEVVKILNFKSNYLVGENINLTILYSYSDESVVIWTKNSSNIALWTTRFNDTNEKFPNINLFGNGSLYISNVTTDYTDIYKVTTFDKSGTLEASITVNIFERSGVVKILNSQNNYLVGENINLTILYSYRDESVVIWTKNSSNIALWTTRLNDTNDKFPNINPFSNGSLYISNVTTNYTDIYKVTTFDKSGTLEASITVNIFEPVENVTVKSPNENFAEGSLSALNLTCNSTRGAGTVLWEKDGKPLGTVGGNYNYTLLDGNLTLELIRPNRTYSGNYSCNISNPVSSGEGKLTLYISYSDSAGPLSTGAIAGIVVGSVVGALLLVALFVLLICCLGKKKGKIEKDPKPHHKDVLRTVSGTTLSPDDPAFFTRNNIMYRSSSISMGSYIMPSGDNTENEYDFTSSQVNTPKMKQATQL